MKLIDSHCHLYNEEFAADIEAVVKRAIGCGVEKFFLPAIDKSTADSMLALEEKYTGKVFSMMGVHPCSINAAYESELAFAAEWLTKRKFVAIGEIGLDFYWDKTFTQQQYKAFEIQMQWALDYNLPIVIHTRNAMQETIETVKPFAAKGLRGIFHCFSGTIEDAETIIEMGFLLGIGGVLTYKNSGLQQVIEQIDLNHLVLETDAPYLTPVPYRGKRNESSYLLLVAEKLAAIKNTTPNEVAATTSANAEKIFGC